MPAGDLITADGQVEIRGLLLGPGTNYIVEGVDGLFTQDVKTVDVDLIGDGSYFGPDRLAAASKVLTVSIVDSTPADVDDRLQSFLTAWAIGTDVELHWQSRGSHRYLTGRTRRCQVVDEVEEHVRVVAEFAAQPGAIDAGGS